MIERVVPFLRIISKTYEGILKRMNSKLIQSSWCYWYKLLSFWVSLIHILGFFYIKCILRMCYKNTLVQGWGGGKAKAYFWVQVFDLFMYMYIIFLSYFSSIIKTTAIVIWRLFISDKVLNALLQLQTTNYKFAISATITDRHRLINISMGLSTIQMMQMSRSV